MMNFVPLIHHVGYHPLWWGIDNGRRNDVWHISKIAVLRNMKGRVGIEAAYGAEMHISPVVLLSSSITS